MSLLGFFGEKENIKGTIGYFNLSDWWLSEFTVKERAYIQDRFQPLGFSGNSLTEGNITSTSQTAIGLLSGLSGWFSKKEDRYIAYKLIAKAEELISNKSRILDIHFLYSTKVEFLYKDRDSVPQGLEKAIEACQQQIDYSNKAAIAFKKQHNDSLPSHKGYQQLVIIKEKQKNFLEAINLSEKALKQGWAGDWEKRIERCKKKQQKNQ